MACCSQIKPSHTHVMWKVDIMHVSVLLGKVDLEFKVMWKVDIMHVSVLLG